MERNENIKQRALDTFYSHLNPMQREAVFQVNGPVLILAGAGSGKTTVLINRIDYMIRFGNSYHNEAAKILTLDEEHMLEKYLSNEPIEEAAITNILGTHPIEAWKILAITFTNKAADELKERLKNQLGEVSESVHASTFHSFCVRILRREIHLLAYENNFTIYDTDDSLRVIKDGLKYHRLDEKMLPSRSVLNAISRAKDELRTPKDILEAAAGDYRAECIARVYDYYQATLRQANALDFDDLIVLTVRLFQNHPERLDYYQNRYQYIMVDEYQDTNHAQYLLVSLLAAKRQNLCVVGDDDQSIYKFRGATIENILSFEKQFKGATVIRLEQNYRSTQNILSAANAVIANNTERKGKNLWTDKGDGAKIQFLRLQDERQEARTVADAIVENVNQGALWSDHAVLYRMNAQSNAMEQALAQRGVPYRIVGGLRFYERKEIKDIVAYLSLINNTTDNLRFMRIVNEPRRGIGNVTTTTLQEIADTLGESVYQVAKHADQYAPLSRSSNALLAFIEIIEGLQAAVPTMSLAEFFDELLEKTEHLSALESQGEEGITRIENIMELKSNMISYEEEEENPSLSGFLEEIALYTDLDSYDEQTDAITLMTVHSAKGLEFSTVYLIGMDEGIFPGRSAQDFPEEIEEERRLAYVAITRSKEHMIITSTERRMLFGRTMWGNPSRFVKEIPEEYLEVQDMTTSRRQKTAVGSSSRERSSRSIGVGTMASHRETVNYAVGEWVNHRIYGKGKIIESSPMGNDTLLEIEFGEVGKKRIMANFAKLEKIDG